MTVIPDSLITKATLIMFRKNPSIFIITTLVMIIPNLIGAIAYPEYAGQFLALAILPLVNGTIFTIVGSTAAYNKLRYPKKDDLDDFAKYARFPQGMPEGVDADELKLP
jgi:hypothetical protein